MAAILAVWRKGLLIKSKASRLIDLVVSRAAWERRMGGFRAFKDLTIDLTNFGEAEKNR